MPVFFLYFSRRLTVDGMLVLLAVTCRALRRGR
jgi:hypothetical protein